VSRLVRRQVRAADVRLGDCLADNAGKRGQVVTSIITKPGGRVRLFHGTRSYVEYDGNPLVTIHRAPGKVINHDAPKVVHQTTSARKARGGRALASADNSVP
jgi:hypothetical protein